MSYRLAGPLMIDGRIDEAAWKLAPWTEPFVDIVGSGEPAPTWDTRASLLWDEQYLYIAATLVEPHLWATLTERDAIIYQDHDFEVFLDPDGDGLEYYEIEINALGVVFDLFLDKPYKRGGRAHIPWDLPGLQSAVHLEGTLNDPEDEDTGWSVELAIPWRELVPPKPYGEGGAGSSSAGTTEAASDASAEASADADASASADAVGVVAVGEPPADGDVWRINFSRVQWPLDEVDGAYVKSVTPSSANPHPEDNWVWSPQGEINMHVPGRWGAVTFRDRPPAEASREAAAPVGRARGG